MKPIGIALLGDFGNWIHNLPTNFLVYTITGIVTLFIATLFTTTDSFIQTDLGINFFFLSGVFILYQLTWEALFDIDLIKRFYHQLQMSGISKKQFILAFIFNEILSFKIISIPILFMFIVWTNFNYFQIIYASIWALLWIVSVHILFNSVIGLLKLLLFRLPFSKSHYIIRSEFYMLLIGIGVLIMGLLFDQVDEYFSQFSSFIY